MPQIKSALTKKISNPAFSYPRWSLRNMLGQLGFSDGGFVKMQLSSDSATVIYYDRDNQKR